MFWYRYQNNCNVGRKARSYTVTYAHVYINWNIELYVKVSLYAVSQNNCKDLKIEQIHVYSNIIDYIENLFWKEWYQNNNSQQNHHKSAQRNILCCFDDFWHTNLQNPREWKISNLQDQTFHMNSNHQCISPFHILSGNQNSLLVHCWRHCIIGKIYSCNSYKHDCWEIAYKLWPKFHLRLSCKNQSSDLRFRCILGYKLNKTYFYTVCSYVELV